MRLLFLADLHLEFAPFTSPVERADVIVLAGDIHVGAKGIQWAQETFGETPVIYIAGNHEYYRQSYPDHLDKMREAAKGTNVLFLENDSTEIGGVTFLGCTLWTDFNLYGDVKRAMSEAETSMNDYHVIQLGLTGRRLQPEDTLSPHKKSVQWLKKTLKTQVGKPVVVVTHHAPSLQSVAGQYKRDLVSAAFASPLDRLVAASKAKLWLHGHVHHACDYPIGNTRVLCNPRGYPNETGNGFDPQLVLDVSF
ncbi:MAG: metallophosphoesterase [Elusimicrobiota bacterium]